MCSRAQNKLNSISFKYYAIEKIIFNCVITLLILLVVSQALLCFDTLKVFTNKSLKLEGAAVQNKNYNNIGNLQLYVNSNDNTSSLFIYINGEKVANFSNKVVNISVRNKDCIEINAVNYNGYAKVSILSVSKNIIYPKVNKEVSIKNNIQYLCSVKIK